MDKDKGNKKKPLKLSSSGRLQIRKNLGPAGDKVKNSCNKKTIQIVFKNKNNQQKSSSTTQSNFRGSSSLRTPRPGINSSPQPNFTSPNKTRNFENKNKNLITPLNHELNQINELKGAVAQLSSSIEERLGNFGTSIGNSLTQQTQNTQKSLMEMHERLAIIDRAQENIHSLSTQVNDLQNILSNKQLRGAFGEVQLENIVKDALPQNAYQFQYTLISVSYTHLRAHET